MTTKRGSSWSSRLGSTAWPLRHVPMLPNIGFLKFAFLKHGSCEACLQLLQTRLWGIAPRLIGCWSFNPRACTGTSLLRSIPIYQYFAIYNFCNRVLTCFQFPRMLCRRGLTSASVKAQIAAWHMSRSSYIMSPRFWINTRELHVKSKFWCTLQLAIWRQVMADQQSEMVKPPYFFVDILSWPLRTSCLAV